MLGAAIAVTGGLALAGCGSSGGGGDEAAPKTVTVTKTAPAPAGLTKAQYIAEVDAICRAWHAATAPPAARVRDTLGDTPTDDDVRAASTPYEQLVAIDRRFNDRVDAVVPAQDYRAQVQPYLSANRTLTTLYARMLKAMRAVDVEEGTVVDEQIRDVEADRRTAATSFGFEVCGRSRPAGNRGE